MILHYQFFYNNCISLVIASIPVKNYMVIIYSFTTNYFANYYVLYWALNVTFYTQA